MPGKYVGGDTSKQDTVYNNYDNIAVSSSGIYQSVDDHLQHYKEPAELKCAIENGPREIPTARRRNIYRDLSSNTTNSFLPETPYEELDRVSSFSLIVLAITP